MHEVVRIAAYSIWRSRGGAASAGSRPARARRPSAPSASTNHQAPAVAASRLCGLLRAMSNATSNPGFAAPRRAAPRFAADSIRASTSPAPIIVLVAPLGIGRANVQFRRGCARDDHGDRTASRRRKVEPRTRLVWWIPFVKAFCEPAIAIGHANRPATRNGWDFSALFELNEAERYKSQHICPRSETRSPVAWPSVMLSSRLQAQLDESVSSPANGEKPCLSVSAYSSCLRASRLSVSFPLPLPLTRRRIGLWQRTTPIWRSRPRRRR
jgi:hypothetical protein